MSNLNFGNKEFLNIQMQVLKNAQDIEALKNRPLLEIQIVEELPETGEAGVLYLVPAADGDEGNLYEEFVWIEGEWEQVGSTEIDLSAYPTLAGDNEFTGDNTFGDVAVEDIETHNIAPETSGDYNIGAAAKKYEAGYINTIHADWKVETPRLQSTTDEIAVLSTGENATVYIYPDVDGKLALGKSNKRISTVYASGVTNDYSALSIKGKSGVSFTCDNGSEIKPSSDAQLTLGNATARWKTLHLSHYVTWGNNVLIGKDGSNRFYVAGSDGNTKIKVGVNETYFANHVEPDANNTYDLGRTSVAWRDIYLSGKIKNAAGTTAVDPAKLVEKPDYANPDVWASGKLASGTGSATIDYTDETGVGVPEWGLYMFTYGNAQCYVAFTESMWLGMLSGYPIRVACPCLEEAGGVVEGNTGNLKIEKTGTTGIIKVTVASTVTGSATSTNGWDFQFIKVM